MTRTTSLHGVAAAPLPPAVALLLRALFKRDRPSRDAPFALPEIVHAMPAPAPAALARYNALLGYAPDRLPLTFFYLPTQRAHLALLLCAGFPYRVMGMIHVENAMRLHRRADARTPLRLVTRARVDAPTRSGARFVHLETTGLDGARAVYSCSSTYLAPAGGRKDGGRGPAQALAGASEVVGSWHVGPACGRAYARVSGDWNPIHLGRWPARLLGLRAPIIHGMHSVGRAAAVIEAVQGAPVTAIAAAFRAPVALGSDLVLSYGASPGSFVLARAGRGAVEGSFRTAAMDEASPRDGA